MFLEGYFLCKSHLKGWDGLLFENQHLICVVYGVRNQGNIKKILQIRSYYND